MSRSIDGRRVSERSPDGDARPGSVDPATARRALARLTRDRATDRAVVRRARAATRDAEAAAAFVDRVGIDRLRRAATRLEGTPAEEARAALAAFERYRRAAVGDARRER